MTRTKAILSAAGITSTVLLTILAISLINMIASGTIVIRLPATDQQAQLDQLEARQAALDQAAGVMTDRQIDYAAEIAAAEQHVIELQAAIKKQQVTNITNQEAVIELDAQVNAINATIAQLEAEAQLWQTKEAGYAAQIESANEQIRALQSQVGR